MRTRSRAQSAKHYADVDDSDLSPARFAFAATRVAAAQIVNSKGFKSVQRSAIDILADAVGKYLQALAETAAASAASTGRTECNLYDVIAGLETLAAAQGFPGASNPNRPILSSSTLTDLSRFVKYSLEMPFAQAIRRHPPPHKTVGQLQVAGYGHIPRWLPAVPDMAIEREAGRRKEEGLYGCLVGDEMRVAFSGNEGGNEEESNGVGVDSHRGIEGVLVDKKMRIGLPKKRGRVRFKIGMREGSLGLRGLRNGFRRVGKRISCENRIDDDNSKRRKKMKWRRGFNTQD